MMRDKVNIELGEVVVAEQELYSLARATGCVTGEPRNAGEIGCLVQCEKQARREDSALLPRRRCRSS